MSTNWAAEAAFAAAAIADEGMPITVRRVVRGAFDPATGEHSEESVVDTSAAGIYLATGKTQWLGGSQVLASDRIMLAAVEPGIGDTVLADRDWFVVAVEPISPAGTLVACKILLRA